MKTVSCVQTVVQFLSSMNRKEYAMNPYIYLGGAILAEVIGTTLMKFSEGLHGYGPLLAQLFAIVHHSGY